MSKTNTVTFERLSKRYRIPHRRDRWGKGTLVSDLAARAKRWLSGGESAWDDVWALRDVSYAVDEGEVVGIIGHNGAGKSTLLKVLTRVTEPTSGRVLVRGHVTSLLEVGTGFHPELTGRENVFLYGAILGMDRPRVAQRFDTIVAFADVARFLDVPLKRWSSGMALRLAFAVASHLEHRTLVVDEALSVGDAAFRARCMARIEEAARHEGRTVLFVSHDLSQIRRLAKRAILLDRGALTADGPTASVLSSYLANFAPRAFDMRRVSAVRLLDAEAQPTGTVQSGAACRIALDVTSPGPLELELETAWGVRVATTTMDVAHPGTHELRIKSLTLGPGPYRIAIAARGPHGELERAAEALTFVVTHAEGPRTEGLVALELEGSS